MNPRRLLVLAAVLVFVAFALRYRGYLLDDAYISLRYSRNLVEGHGLVFNPGERVEGYTCFLWVLLGAAFLRVTSGAMAALQTVSLLSALGLLAVVWRLERQAGGEPSVVPSVVWLLLLEGFGYWATTGMEAMFFSALLALGVTLALSEGGDGRFRGSVAVFLALALVRPEGAYAFVLAAAGGGWVARLRRGVWPWREKVRDAALFLIAYGAYSFWRVHYYGDLLPNTFYAKVTGGAEQWRNGFLNLGQWTLHHPLFAFALAAPAAVLLRHGRSRLRERPELFGIGLVAVGWVVYVVSVGGDFMPFWRFFLPIAPLCAVLLSGLLAWVGEIDTDVRRGSFVLALLAVHLAANLASEEPYRAFVAHRTTGVGLAVGRHLAGRFGPDERIAVNTAGALPYASGQPTIDMLGLVDREIARHPVYVVSLGWAGHRRGWGEYVLSRRPRVVVWYNSAGLAEPHYLGDHQLAENPYFRFFYPLRREKVTPPEPEGEVLARFLGTPFGDGGAPLAPELGVRFEVRGGTLRRTLARSAPITLHYFELRRDREELWEASRERGADLSGFLDEVTALWRREAAARPPGDPAALRAVEGLCRRAAERVGRGDLDGARELLSEAVRANAAARSPLVYQYVANVAVLERNLFLAVQAQEEALRLAPGDELYRRNLENLLRVGFEEFSRRKAVRSPDPKPE